MEVISRIPDLDTDTARVSKVTFYKYFTNKGELARRVLDVSYNFV